MKKSVTLEQDGDVVEITLPNGKIVNIWYSDIEDDALPELDIELPEPMVANCWAKGLTPPFKVDDHALECVQIVIPIPA